MSRGTRALQFLVWLGAGLTLGVYATRAARLIAYPFDWSPDEGLLLDYARRLLEAPGSLYPRAIGPFPCIYTPLVPLLLTPLVAAASAPLALARVLVLGCLALTLASVTWLVARRGGLALGLAGAALVVAPLDLSYWLALVRVDGPMLALWLLAAIPLLPDRLAPGADRLSRGRLASGSLLLILAVLAKPTAVLHGAPLVLGWFVVDRRSAWRLTAAVTALGLATLALLQGLSGGGFLFGLGLYAAHPHDLSWVRVWTLDYAARTWPVLLIALSSLWLALRSSRSAPRDGSWLLILGGLMAVPALAKLGAYWNYLLPLHVAVVVLGSRMAAQASAGAAPAGRRPLLAAGFALVAVALATTQRFPTPTRQDAATSAAFVDFVTTTAREHPGPLLLLRSDYASWLVGQPVAMSATDFRALASSRTPGVERILDELRAARYRLVTGPAVFLPLGDPFPPELLQRYELLGSCDIAYFFGREQTLLFAPADLRLAFQPPPGARCRPVSALPR